MPFPSRDPTRFSSLLFSAFFKRQQVNSSDKLRSIPNSITNPDATRPSGLIQSVPSPFLFSRYTNARTRFVPLQESNKEFYFPSFRRLQKRLQQTQRVTE
mmetsp:Transcript_42749/g.84321  ORF Transcript_42749/g.84321 Transcript_42749/m.84321 type:complete len:100 (-) Transcript_42749:470-769(-)